MCYSARAKNSWQRIGANWKVKRGIRLRFSRARAPNFQQTFTLCVCARVSVRFLLFLSLINWERKKVVLLLSSAQHKRERTKTKEERSLALSGKWYLCVRRPRTHTHTHTMSHSICVRGIPSACQILARVLRSNFFRLSLCLIDLQVKEFIFFLALFFRKRFKVLAVNSKRARARRRTKYNTTHKIQSDFSVCVCVRKWMALAVF